MVSPAQVYSLLLQLRLPVQPFLYLCDFLSFLFFRLSWFSFLTPPLLDSSVLEKPARWKHEAKAKERVRVQ